MQDDNARRMSALATEAAAISGKSLEERWELESRLKAEREQHAMQLSFLSSGLLPPTPSF